MDRGNGTGSSDDDLPHGFDRSEEFDRQVYDGDVGHSLDLYLPDPLARTYSGRAWHDSCWADGHLQHSVAGAEASFVVIVA